MKVLVAGLTLFVVLVGVAVGLYMRAGSGFSGQGRLYLEFLKEHSESGWHSMWDELWALEEAVTVPRSVLKAYPDDKTAASVIVEHIVSYAFWVDDRGTDGQYAYIADNTGITITGIKYFPDAVKMRADFEQALVRVYGKVYVEGYPEATVHNINRFLYDTVMYGDESSMEGQTAYSVLLDSEALCGGFARTFNTLALLSGIDSRIVVGYLVRPDEVIRHAWNVYYIDGVEYVIDTTANRTSNNISRLLHLEKSRADLSRYLEPELHASGVRLMEVSR